MTFSLISPHADVPVLEDWVDPGVMPTPCIWVKSAQSPWLLHIGLPEWYLLCLLHSFKALTRLTS